MRYARLGTSDLRVSRLCLGTVFRSEPDEPTGIATIHAAAEHGCNFLDCADFYGTGRSERIVGAAVKGQRDRFVITTKVGSPMPDAPAGGLQRNYILRACEASLRRLDTDYIDCYLCHFPDADTPLDETLSAFDRLVTEGKVRYPGVSNFRRGAGAGVGGHQPPAGLGQLRLQPGGLQPARPAHRGRAAAGESSRPASASPPTRPPPSACWPAATATASRRRPAPPGTAGRTTSAPP